MGIMDIDQGTLNSLWTLSTVSLVTYRLSGLFPSVCSIISSARAWMDHQSMLSTRWIWAANECSAEAASDLIVRFGDKEMQNNNFQLAKRCPLHKNHPFPLPGKSASKAPTLFHWEPGSRKGTDPSAHSTMFKLSLGFLLGICCFSRGLSSCLFLQCFCSRWFLGCLILLFFPRVCLLYVLQAVLVSLFFVLVCIYR